MSGERKEEVREGECVRERSDEWKPAYRFLKQQSDDQGKNLERQQNREHAQELREIRLTSAHYLHLSAAD